jgi:hypothetical protein
MKFSLKPLIALGLLAVAGAALAQPGGGRGGMMNMQMPDAFLIMQPDVQKDIKLTEKQLADITAAQAKLAEKYPWMRMMMGGGRGQGGQGQGGAGRGQGGGAGAGAGQGQGQGAGRGQGGGGFQGFDPSQMADAMKEAEKAITDVTTDEQEARLFQIGLQTAGGRALFRDDVQKKLDLKAAQKKSLMDLQTGMNSANMELFQRMRDQEITREELTAAMTKNTEILNTEAVKVLTAEQKTAFEAMKGPKFEGRVNQPGMGGGRGQGGGPRPGGGNGGGGATPPPSI